MYSFEIYVDLLGENSVGTMAWIFLLQKQGRSKIRSFMLKFKKEGGDCHKRYVITTALDEDVAYDRSS